MPNFEGIEFAKRNATPVRFVSQTDLHGKLRCVHATFTSPTGDLAANDTISLAELPRNALVVGHMSRLKCDLLGASRTLDLGYLAHTDESDQSAVATDLDAFVDGADASAAVDMLFTAATVGGNLPEHRAVGKMTISLKILGASMPATKTCELWLFYLEA